MYRRLYVFNLIIFLAIWLGITGYTLFSLVDSTVHYSLTLFAAFLLVLELFGLPLIWFWYNSREKTIQIQTAAACMAVILVFFWGPFSLIQELLSLRLNDVQLKWLAFAYIWEVIIIGLIVTYAVLRISRFADQFMRGTLNGDLNPAQIHERLARIPLRASIVFAIMVLFGFLVGCVQFYFASFPLSEIAKNFINGILQGTLSSFAVFFFLERITAPALKKSGALIMAGNPERSIQRRSTLFSKIYAVSALLALTSAGFFLTMSYARGQAVLEQELTGQLARELERVKTEFEETGELAFNEPREVYFGPHRAKFYAGTEFVDAFLAPEGVAPGESAQLLATASASTAPSLRIDRNSSTKIVGVQALNASAFAAGILFIGGGSYSLNLLFFHSALIFLTILAIVAILSTLFGRSVTIPIHEIEEGGRSIGQGDFSHPITVYTNDELEDLSNALNEASHKLKISYANLEHQIRQRTSQLAEANRKKEQQILELDRTSKLLLTREGELEKANNALRQLDEAKTQFVSVAAHQLRTPLSVSKWTFQMLLSGDFGQLSTEQADVLKRGNEMNEQMIGLVSDLLDVARIESGKFAYVFEPIDVSNFFAEMENLFSQKTKERQISFRIQIPPKGVLYMKGDASRLRMVFQNLLDNAFKFTRPGGVVALQADQKDDMIEFTVTDSGIGIAQDEIPKLFNKFYRAHNAVAMDVRGTGLGLYIVASIIQGHGGKIWVQSQEGKGTTFHFIIPVAQPPKH